MEQWNLNAVFPSDWQVDVQGLRTAWKSFLGTCSPSTNTLVVMSNGVARFLLDVVEGGESAPKKLRTVAYGVVSLSANDPFLKYWDRQAPPNNLA